MSKPKLRSKRRNNAPVTLIELGRRLNLSARAVSEVLNGGNSTSTVRVNPETRKRVERLAKKLGYRANRSAQTLRLGKRRGLIGVLASQGFETIWTERVSYAHMHAKRNSFLLLTHFMSANNAEESRKAVDYFLDYRVEAVVLFHPLDQDELERLLRGGIQVVSVGAQKPANIRGYFADKTSAAMRLTRHLIEQGRRDIRIIRAAGTRSPTHSGAIENGFRRALAEAAREGLQVRGDVIRVEVAFEGFQARDFPDLHALGAPGYIGMRNLIQAGDIPDAVIGIIDIISHGAVGACAEAGIAVPRRVAVAGFSDEPWSCTGMLPLTTVRQPLSDMCAAAFADLKAALAEGVKLPQGDVYLPCELILRKSTAGA